jgi:hypothetical protein
MTATPETWDDVGTLRLEVNSISQKVIDVQEGLTVFHGLNDLQLQKLRDEMLAHNAALIGREQRKERLKTSALLGCFLVLQIFILCVNSGASSGLVEKLYPAAWKTHVDDTEASEAKRIQQNSVVENSQRLKHRPVNDATQEVELVTEVHMHEEDPKDNRTKTILTFGKELVSEQIKMNARAEDQLPEVEVPTVQDPQPLPDAESLVQSSAEDQEDSNEHAFQQFSHGWFWVCFPAGDLEWSLQKYTPIFEEFARSQKWKVNAYCWLRATKLLHEERLCDDPEKITFGVEMEKKTTVVTDNKNALSINGEMPKHSAFDDCVDFLRRPESKALFEMQSPSRFHQTFPPDQDIQASLVKEFLNDVHSGKIRQIPHGKGDL